MNIFAANVRWLVGLFLLMYAVLYALIPVVFLLSRFNELDFDDELIDSLTAIDAAMILAVSVLFTISAICLFRSKAAAIPAYVVGLLIDIIANVIVEFRVDFESDLTVYDYARDSAIMLGILVCMIWLKSSRRLN